MKYLSLGGKHEARDALALIAPRDKLGIVLAELLRGLEKLVRGLRWTGVSPSGDDWWKERTGQPEENGGADVEYEGIELGSAKVRLDEAEQRRKRDAAQHVRGPQ
jgi:hypothetical protein